MNARPAIRSFIIGLAACWTTSADQLSLIPLADARRAVVHMQGMLAERGGQPLPVLHYCSLCEDDKPQIWYVHEAMLVVDEDRERGSIALYGQHRAESETPFVKGRYQEPVNYRPTSMPDAGRLLHADLAYVYLPVAGADYTFRCAGRMLGMNCQIHVEEMHLTPGDLRDLAVAETNLDWRVDWEPAPLRHPVSRSVAVAAAGALERTVNSRQEARLFPLIHYRADPAAPSFDVMGLEDALAVADTRSTNCEIRIYGRTMLSAFDMDFSEDFAAPCLATTRVLPPPALRPVDPADLYVPSTGYTFRCLAMMLNQEPNKPVQELHLRSCDFEILGVEPDINFTLPEPNSWWGEEIELPAPGAQQHHR